MIISPSLLSADFMNLEQELARFESLEELWIHLDIMDGHFVPNLTFGPTVLKGIAQNTKHKLDAHFMVTNPEDYVDSFAKLGVHNFTFHWESIVHHDRFISLLKERFPSVGISLNPSTPLSLIPGYLLKKIDLLLVMSVNPGFGGQSFIDGVLKKIEEAKQKHPHLMIQVDGGVSDTNAGILQKAGATNLVAGSYIFSEPNQKYEKRIALLR